MTRPASRNGSGPLGDDPRQARLKAALKANIARRKAQGAARRGGGGDGGAAEPDPAGDRAPDGQANDQTRA